MTNTNFPTYHAPITTRHDVFECPDNIPSDVYTYMLRTLDHDDMIQFCAFQLHKRTLKLTANELSEAVTKRADRIAAAKKKPDSKAASPFFFCSNLWSKIEDFRCGSNSDWRRKFNNVIADIDRFPSLKLWNELGPLAAIGHHLTLKAVNTKHRYVRRWLEHDTRGDFVLEGADWSGKGRD